MSENKEADEDRANDKSSAPVLVVAEIHDVAHHHLRVLVPASSTWLDDLAAEYRRLRTSSRVPPQALSFEGVDVLSVAEVEAMLASSCVPQYESGNFGVARSDFAELILGLVLEREYGCIYGYRSLRDRELRQRPGRGIDQIGVEASSSTDGVAVTLVLGEAKLSTERACPPHVVDGAPDCLRNQHRSHLAEREATFDKIIDASRGADDPYAQLLLRIAAVLFRDVDPRLRIVAASCLVRPEGTAAAPDDFGTFHSQVDDYRPADVRFLLIRLPGDIDTLVEEFARLAGITDPGAAA